MVTPSRGWVSNLKKFSATSPAQFTYKDFFPKLKALSFSRYSCPSKCDTRYMWNELDSNVEQIIIRLNIACSACANRKKLKNINPFFLENNTFLRLNSCNLQPQIQRRRVLCQMSTWIWRAIPYMENVYDSRFINISPRGKSSSLYY